jgi:hypothetical protein
MALTRDQVEKTIQPRLHIFRRFPAAALQIPIVADEIRFGAFKCNRANVPITY